MALRSSARRHARRDRQRVARAARVIPAVDNPVAVRAYEKVGFKPAGVMREYCRAPDGTWHGGLLMDLLARELGQEHGTGRVSVG